MTADQVSPRTVASFVVRSVGGYPEEISARLTGRGRAYCLQTSMVALTDEVIVGAQLTLTRGREMLVESKVVDAAHRGGWANLALMYRTVVAAEHLGIQTIVFEHDTREHDTGKLARRLSATPVGRRQCWGYSIPLPEV